MRIRNAIVIILTTTIISSLGGCSIFSMKKNHISPIQNGKTYNMFVKSKCNCKVKRPFYVNGQWLKM